MFKAQFSEGKEKTTTFCDISDNGYLVDKVIHTFLFNAVL